MAITVSNYSTPKLGAIHFDLVYTSASGAIDFALPRTCEAFRLIVNTTTFTGATDLDLTLLTGPFPGTANGHYNSHGAIISNITTTGYTEGTAATTDLPFGPYARIDTSWTGTNTNWVAKFYIAYF